VRPVAKTALRCYGQLGSRTAFFDQHESSPLFRGWQAQRAAAAKNGSFTLGRAHNGCVGVLDVCRTYATPTWPAHR
jgi:hypothetical protein